MFITLNQKLRSFNYEIKIMFIFLGCFGEGIVERDGLVGLYRGFVPNALKTLPNSRSHSLPIITIPPCLESTSSNFNISFYIESEHKFRGHKLNKANCSCIR